MTDSINIHEPNAHARLVSVLTAKQKQLFVPKLPPDIQTDGWEVPYHLLRTAPDPYNRGGRLWANDNLFEITVFTMVDGVKVYERVQPNFTAYVHPDKVRDTCYDLVAAAVSRLRRRLGVIV